MRRLLLVTCAATAFAACEAPPPPPDDPFALYMKARVARAGGEYARAALLLERASAVAPDEAPIAAALGEARFLLGHDLAARSALERATLLEPDDVPSNVLLARLDVRDRRPTDAFARLIALDERRPGEVAVLEMLHPLLLWAGQSQCGLEIFERALELEPGLALAHEARGDFLACLGRIDDALASYRRALALDPSRHGAELKAAHMLEKQADSLLRRLAAPPRAGVVLPAAPDAAAPVE